MHLKQERFKIVQHYIVQHKKRGCQKNIGQPLLYLKLITEYYRVFLLDCF